MFRIRDSIILRLWFPVVLFLLLLALGIAFYYTERQKEVITSNSNEVLLRTGRTVALGVELSLTQEDFSGLFKSYEFVKKDSVFDFIAIVTIDSQNRQQEVLTTFPASILFNPLVPPAGKYTFIDVPFQTQMFNGFVRIGKSVETIEKEVFQLNRPVYIAVTTLFVVVVTLLFFIIQKVVQPLRRMAGLISELHIPMDELMMLKRNSWGEVRVLTTNFILLQERLNKEHEQNDSLFSKLDSLVKERTSDLEMARVRLINAQRISSMGSFDYVDGKVFLSSESLNDILKLKPGCDLNDFLLRIYTDDRIKLERYLNQQKQGLRFDDIIRFSTSDDAELRWARLLCNFKYTSPHEFYIAGTFQDITAQKSIEDELLKRESIFAAIAQATSALITSTDFNQSVTEAMSIIGNSIGVDRVYIFEVTQDINNNVWSHCKRFGWTSESALLHLDNPGLHLVQDTEITRIFYEPLMNNHYYSVNVDEICNEGLRQLFADQNIVSLLFIPVFIGNRFWGMVGFDDCHTQRIWKNYELDMLRTFSSNLAAALVRHDSQIQIQRLSLVAENTTNYVIITDQTKRIQWVNDSLLKATGYKMDELIGCTPKIFQSANTNPNTIQRINELLSRFEIVRHEEVLNVDKNGNEYWLDLNIVPLSNQEGVCTGFIAVETDITERIRMEDNLRSLNQDLENKVIENTKKYLEINKAYNEQEKLAAIGEVAAGIAHDLNTPISTVLLGTEGMVDRIGYFLEHVLLRVSPEDISFCFEISKSLERELFVSGSQLEREKSALLGYIQLNHEIYIPNLDQIVALLVQCRILDQDKVTMILNQPNPLELLHVIDTFHSINTLGNTIIQTSKKSAAVVGNLKEYIRRKDPGKKKNINLYQSISAALNIFNYSLGNQIKVETRIDPAIFIQGYEIKLLQLWTNLIKNAIEAMQQSVDPALKIYTKSDQSSVCISFENNGPEIPKEILQKMFTRFYTTKGDQQGTGLGLTIVKNVVREHGGGIEITSENRTTVFTIKLPLF